MNKADTVGTAVVVGAAGGVGAAVAHRLADDGYALFLADSAPLDDLVAELTERTSVVGQAVDLLDEASVRAMAQRLASTGVDVQALVVVAGVLQQAGDTVTLATSEWDRVMGVNLRGPFLVCKYVTPLLPDDAGASVVTIGSWWGHSGHAYFSAYCASKAGLRVYTQALAEELAPRRIRANVIAPGNIDTSMHRKALVDEAVKRGIATEEMQAVEWAKIPLGVPGPPSCIADAVSFLVSPRASYMTGATVDVNGGVILR